MQLEMGNEISTGVSYIAQFYSPEELVEKLIVSHSKTNVLEEKNQGMILAASKGKNTLVTIEEDMDSGTKIVKGGF